LVGKVEVAVDVELFGEEFVVVEVRVELTVDELGAIVLFASFE
jgi:hypothetical protein